MISLLLAVTSAFAAESCFKYGKPGQPMNREACYPTVEACKQVNSRAGDCRSQSVLVASYCSPVNVVNLSQCEGASEQRIPPHRPESGTSSEPVRQGTTGVAE